MKKYLILLLLFFCLFSLNNNDKRHVIINNNDYLVGDMSISSSLYTLDDSYIKFVKSKTTKDVFLSSFDVNNAKLNLECNNGTNYVGSACLMQVEDSSMQVTPYSVVVVGDVTGDGNNTITDIVKIADYSSKQRGLANKSYIFAADVNNDNNVSNQDFSYLAYYMLVNEDIPIKNDSSVGSTIELLTKSLILSRGFSKKLEVKVSDNAVSVIEWLSSNKKVVTVDSTGMVTGVGAGNAVITVKSSKGDTASMKVNVVVVVPATGVSFSNIPSQMKVGSSYVVESVVSPSDATNKKLTWQSSNTSVATVDNNGVVRAVGSGNVKITATTTTGKSNSFDITVVVPSTKVTLNKTNVNLIKGMTTSLIATVSPDNVTDKNVKWSSNNTSVATVDDNGKVTAVSNGSALITATYGDGEQMATCNVVVENLSLKLSDESVTLIDENVKQLTAKLSSTEVEQSIVWTSDNTSVATVDSTGKVKAKSIGTAVVTATSKFDSSVIDTCTITVRAAMYLFVGNSKTYYPGSASSDNGIPKRFESIAANRGYEIEYVYAVMPGKTLGEVYTNKLDKITSKKFDYVILQEQTASYSNSDITNYYNGSLQIIKKVMEKNSSVKSYIRKLWAKSNSSSEVIQKGYNNTLTIVSKLKNDMGYDVGVINDGPLFYDIFNTYGNNLPIFVTDDLVHQNANGAYLSALCIYSTIYGNDPTRVTYNASIDNSDVSILKNTAKKHCYNG